MCGSSPVCPRTCLARALETHGTRRTFTVTSHSARVQPLPRVRTACANSNAGAMNAAGHTSHAYRELSAIAALCERAAAAASRKSIHMNMHLSGAQSSRAEYRTAAGCDNDSPARFNFAHKYEPRPTTHTVAHTQTHPQAASTAQCARAHPPAAATRVHAHAEPRPVAHPRPIHHHRVREPPGRRARPPISPRHRPPRTIESIEVCATAVYLLVRARVHTRARVLINRYKYKYKYKKYL